MVVLKQPVATIRFRGAYWPYSLESPIPRRMQKPFQSIFHNNTVAVVPSVISRIANYLLSFQLDCKNVICNSMRTISFFFFFNISCKCKWSRDRTINCTRVQKIISILVFFFFTILWLFILRSAVNAFQRMADARANVCVFDRDWCGLHCNGIPEWAIVQPSSVRLNHSNNTSLSHKSQSLLNIHIN